MDIPMQTLLHLAVRRYSGECCTVHFRHIIHRFFHRGLALFSDMRDHVKGDLLTFCNILVSDPCSGFECLLFLNGQSSHFCQKESCAIKDGRVRIVMGVEFSSEFFVFINSTLRALSKHSINNKSPPLLVFPCETSFPCLSAIQYTFWDTETR